MSHTHYHHHPPWHWWKLMVGPPHFSFVFSGGFFRLTWRRMMRMPVVMHFEIVTT
ncbi:hypothetical protein HanIR_Chr06g0261991 [Helianthus annuus]|nr:hypothetical protein HanIR_Chr06g0261991 [Helianthus annuus]